MKKRILLFTAVAAMGSLIFSSYLTGPAANGYDCTGAESAGTGSFTNPTGCTVGSGCHASSATSTITVAIELDSAGVATTHYRPGKSYTIKITGTNGTSTSFPNYGFQLAVLKGTASSGSNSDAGVLSGAPTSTHIQSPGTHTQLTVAEHSTALTVTGATFTQSITWAAPTTNVGNISIWAAANFTNGSTTSYGGDQWNTNHLQIDFWPSTESVSAEINDVAITAFPNPASTNLNLQLTNAQPGAYTLHVFNMNGSLIATQDMEVSNAIQTNTINTGNWAAGLYNVVVEKDGSSKNLLVVKQ